MYVNKCKNKSTPNSQNMYNLITGDMDCLMTDGDMELKEDMEM